MGYKIFKKVHAQQMLHVFYEEVLKGRLPITAYPKSNKKQSQHKV